MSAMDVNAFQCALCIPTTRRLKFWQRITVFFPFDAFAKAAVLGWSDPPTYGSTNVAARVQHGCGP